MSNNKPTDQTFLSELPGGLRQAVIAAKEQKTDPRSESRALAAVRELSGNAMIPHTVTAPREQRPIEAVRQRQTASRVRWAVAATILLGFLGLLSLTSDSASRAFAQVQQAVAELSFMLFRARYVDGNTLSQQIMLAYPSRGRVEFEDGCIFIFDLTRQESVFLDPGHKQAVLTKGDISSSERNSMGDFLETLRDIKSGTVDKVEPMVIEGKHCSGYRYFDGTYFMHLWVDPDTMLPVYAEGRLKDAVDNNPNVRLDRFQFNPKANVEDFEVVTPPDYSVTVYTRPSKVSLTAEQLTLVPLKGLGPARFGMTKDEIIGVVGRPDGIGPIERTAGTSLRYDSKGFRLTLDKHGRMTDVQCHVNNEGGEPHAVTFPGLTDKGIALGASAEDVFRAYGQPDHDETSRRNASFRSIAYFKLGLNFDFRDNQLNNINAFLPPESEEEIGGTEE